MNAIEKLASLFQRFPGVGPRQAERFVYYLLRQPATYRRELLDALSSLGKHARQCSECFRFFEDESGATICAICADNTRSAERIMVVEKDVDLDAIEKSHAYDGRYVVLGGTRALSTDHAPAYEAKVLARIRKQAEAGTLKEVIFALSATPDGEYTAERTREMLTPLTEAHNVTLSTLGRGLSTGSELEYADAETLKNALNNRR